MADINKEGDQLRKVLAEKEAFRVASGFPSPSAPAMQRVRPVDGNARVPDGQGDFYPVEGMDVPLNDYWTARRIREGSIEVVDQKAESDRAEKTAQDEVVAAEQSFDPMSEATE